MINLDKEQNKETASVRDIEELQEYFTNQEIGYPEELVKRILENHEQTVPKMLAIVEEFFTYTVRDISVEKWNEVTCMFVLLAKLREKRAFPYVVRLCSRPYKTVENYHNDVVQEYGAKFLLSTFNGDLKALCSIVLNQYLYEDSRLAALDIYRGLLCNNVISRDEVLRDYSSFFDELYDDFSQVPSKLILNCCYMQLVEFSEKIEKYFVRGFIDSKYATRESVKESFEACQTEEFKKLDIDSQDEFIDKIRDKNYKLLQEKESNSGNHASLDREIDELCEMFKEDFKKKTVPVYVSTQVVRSEPKIGRNDICSCGSGKKYKKCCIEN